MNIAICNIFGQETANLKKFAKKHGFSAIDWTISLDISDDIFFHCMEELQEFEVRFHGRLKGIDLAYSDFRASSCFLAYKRVIDNISKCNRNYFTIHLGLGVKSFIGLNIDQAIFNICKLNEYAKDKGVIICLENLATGWTSNPQIYKKIIEKTGVNVTFDIGHAKTKIYPSQNGIYFYKSFVEGIEHKVSNAHIYDYEVPKKGHIPPKKLKDISSRLDILLKTSCDFWVIELYSPILILQVKDLLKEYLEQR